MSLRIYTYIYQIYYMYLNIFYKLPTSGIYVKYSEYTPLIVAKSVCSQSAARTI